MDKRYEIRRKNLRRLINDLADGVDARFASKYDYTRSRIGQFLSPTYNDGKSIGDRAARTLENKVGIESLSLDKDVDTINEASWPFSTSISQFKELSVKDIKEIDVLIQAKLANLDND